ncbi:SDR family NAD(P)-dependent oxidoreductase [Congregibacter sp.]|nr:SDR family NAD(P)-dependent oxidoreductase [Congregibacter sp.]MDA8961753.1 SDR family NAD(P)-dependent oxidoreductase [Congregibacter sp.]
MSGDQRVVIISGAGKGLGRAYAHYLAQRGFAIVVNNRRHAADEEASADAVVREIRAAGGKAVAHHGAAEDPQTGESLLALALASFGRLDAVIANAGVSEGTTFCKQTPESIEKNISINLLGTAYLLLPTFRHLYEQRAGHVLVSTSAAGLFGGHGLPAYSASKAGLIGLMQSLALEGAPHQVFVNAVAPFARTQMTTASLEAAAITGLAPDEVAPIVARLLAPDCKISGEVVVAAAGRVARARMLCGVPRDVGDTDLTIDQVLADLAGSVVALEHPDAVAMFQSFIGER